MGEGEGVGMGVRVWVGVRVGGCEGGWVLVASPGVGAVGRRPTIASHCLTIRKKHIIFNFY